MNGNKIDSLHQIESKIYTLRGVQVMLDKDLAAFYQVKPIRLREQVKRNIKRFPSDFMFQLTEKEANHMVSQNAIPSRKHLGGALPYAFTEQGVGALSAVITSNRAVDVSIQIMRVFLQGVRSQHFTKPIAFQSYLLFPLIFCSFLVYPQTFY